MFFSVNVSGRVDACEVGKGREFVCLKGLRGSMSWESKASQTKLLLGTEQAIRQEALDQYSPSAVMNPFASST